MTTPPTSVSPPAAVWPQTLVGTGVLLTGLALAFGALGISSEAGYGGVGPNFLPWLVSIALTVCGAWIIWESRTGGFREMDEPSGAVHPYWAGFIFSCTLCYLLAVQGLRRASGQGGVNSPRTWLIDIMTGLLIAAPVFWMFTQFLAINLPGLTGTGWL